MKLPATLFNTNQPRLLYAIKALGLSLGGAILASIVVGLLIPQVEGPVLDFSVPLIFLFFGLVIFSPVVETLMMWPIIALLAKMTNKTLIIVVVSATLWAILHSLQAAAWGLVIFWSFVVFSISFVEWRKRSIGNALGVTMLIHAGQNLCVFIVIAAGLYLSDPDELAENVSSTNRNSDYSTTIIRADGSKLVATAGSRSSIKLPEGEIILEGRELTLNGRDITLPRENVVLDLSDLTNITINGEPVSFE